MRIVLVGGGGRIGKRLAAALLRLDHQVRIFSRRLDPIYAELTILGDVRDATAVSRALVGCDCVINLATCHGEGVRPASIYFETNVGGARNVVQAAEANDVSHVVFLSSAAVYGLGQPMADESSAIRPYNDYGCSMAQAEAVYSRWAGGASDRSLGLVRSCVVFGEDNRGNVNHLIEQIRRRRFVMVGRGDNRKSIAYAGNLVDFLCTLVDRTPGVHLFNYADKPDLTTGELVRRICELQPGARYEAMRLPLPIALAVGSLFDTVAWVSHRSLAISSTQIRKFCIDTTIATEALQRSGFRPRFTLEDALASTIANAQGNVGTR